MSQFSDLEMAWNTMSKAKSALRRAEFNLKESDQPPLGEHPSSVSVSVERVPKFSINKQDAPQDMLVDKYGRTSHMRTKLADTTKKVCRLEDKYKDSSSENVRSIPDQQRNRSPLREPNLVPVRERPMHAKDPEFSGSSSLYKKVYHDGERFLSNHPENYRQKYPSLESELDRPHQDTSRNITSSTAVKETNVHFLNDFSLSKDRHELPGSKFTRVDVKIPSTKYSSSAEQYTTKVQPRPQAVSKPPSRVLSGTGEVTDTPEDVNRVNETFTRSSSSGVSVTSDNSINWKRRKNIKGFDQHSDGLQKMRELIRNQRLPADAADGSKASEDLLNGGMSQKVPEMAPRSLHSEDEPITSRKYTAYERDAPQPPTRKVATGSKVPTYKGFSEAETRYKTSEAKIVKTSQVRNNKPERAVPQSPPSREQAPQPPLPRKDPRKHRKIALDPKSQDKREESKKMTRIISSKKPSKYNSKGDIVTTHSWRKGQKAIIKELGPNKYVTKPLMSPTRDVGLHKTDQDKESSPEDGGSRPVRTQSSDYDRRTALSEEARLVLADLHHSDSEHDPRMEKKEQKGVNRTSQPSQKRQKMSEQEMTDKLQKVRHYDSNEVRRFITKQRADRKRKQQEEEDSRKKHEENKIKHLEDLYRKQKESARSSSKTRGTEGEKLGPDGVDITDADKPRSNESDKENVSGSGKYLQSRGDVSDSDQSEVTDTHSQQEAPPLPPPPARPRREPIGKGKQSTKSHPRRPDRQDVDTDILLKKYLSGPGPEDTRPPEPPRPGERLLDPDTHQQADQIVKQLTQQTGMSVDDIVSKYARKAEVIRNTYSNTGSGTMPGTVPDVRSRDTVPDVRSRDTVRPPSKTGEKFSRRVERIQAIKNTSTSLQTRLQLESHRLAVQERWAHPRHEGEEEEFVGRYQSMTGNKEDYNVFDQDVPGVQSLASVGYRADDDRHKTSAATKIQAAFRGHSVRQSLTWRMPEHKTVGIHRTRTQGHEMMSDSDLSDSTLTEDSLGEDAFEFKKPKGYPPRVSDRSDWLRPSKPVPSWNPPRSDQYTVFSVYSKKQRTADRARTHQPASAARIDNDMEMEELSRTPTPRSLAGHMTPDNISPRSRSHKSRSHRSHSPPSDVSDQSSIPTDGHLEMRKYQENNSAGRTTSPRSGGGFRSVGDGRTADKEEDVLDNTLTLSVSSDVDMKEESAASMSLVPSRGRGGPQSDRDSDWSDVSSLNADLEPASHKYKPQYQAPGYHGNRYSPAALQQKMAIELNQLESMEESLRQLTDVERTRAVSMAQQETVSLAQILKARQQAHSRDMADLQNKAQQESFEASRQLQEAQKRAADAAQAIAEARTETTLSVRDSTRRLIDTQTEAARATAQAAKHLAEIKGGGEMYSHQMIKDTASAAAYSAVEAALSHYKPRHVTVRRDRSAQYSARESTKYSRTNGSEYSRTEDLTPSTESAWSESYDSATNISPRGKPDKSDKSRSISSDVKTAEDLSRGSLSVKTATVSMASDLSSGEDRKSPDSSIHTESGIKEEGNLSKNESVAEEIGSERDYTAEFETDEEVERSLREVLPSEQQCKKIQRQTSREEVVGHMSFDDIIPPAATGRLSFEDDSFSRFTVDMVNQYMRDEEIRNKHQNALLKLREQALVEKTKAELAWLDQQKQRVRNKGADDSYPQIKQKQRGIIRRLKQEQAEIKLLQEAQRAASKERQMLLKQSQEISKLRKTTQQVRNKMRKSTEKAEVVRPGPTVARGDFHVSIPDISTDDDLSVHFEDGSEISQPTSPLKEKSDSEVHVPSHKLKLMNRKYLTNREKKLQVRQQKTDDTRQPGDEEPRNTASDQEATSHVKGKAKKRKQQDADRSYEMIEGADTLQLTTPRTPRTEGIPESIYSEKPDTARSIPESIYSEKPDTARSIPESIYSEKPDTARSIPESIYSEKPDTARSIPESIYSEKPSTARSTKSGYTSVPEEITSTAPSTVRTRSHIPTASDISVPEEDRTHDDTEINSSINEDYSNDTFETGTERTTQAHTQAHTQASVSRGSTAPSASPGHKNRLPKIAKENGFGIGSKQLSPNNNHIRKNSESESEDSFSVAASETSDASDVENRIRMLTSELKHRKMEAERLKRENQRRRKEKLKQQEELLKQQIENYDKYIDQYKTDLNHSPEQSEHLHPVRPQIKPPSKTSAKVSDRAMSVDRPRSEVDSSSRVSVSSERPLAVDSHSRNESKPEPGFNKDSQKAQVPSKTSESAQKPPQPSNSIQLESKSEISEDIPQSSAKEKTDQSELLLHLDVDKTEDKLPVVTPRSARDSARSVSEIPEDYSEAIDTARTESSPQQSPTLPVHSKPRPAGPEVKDGLVSARSDVSSASEYTDVYSEASETSRHTTHSYSTSVEATKTKDDDKTDDSSTYSSTTVSTKSRIKSKSVISDKSAKDDIEESINTQDDISEAITEEPLEEEEESKSSEAMFQIKASESPRNITDDLNDFNIGDRVLVGDNQPGVLRFKGFTRFAPGCYAGVELDSAAGVNDGIVDDVEYFRCKPNHGLFVNPEKIQKLSVEDDLRLKAESDRADTRVASDDDMSEASLDKKMEEIISGASDAVQDFLSTKDEELKSSAPVIKDSIDDVKQESDVGERSIQDVQEPEDLVTSFETEEDIKSPSVPEDITENKQPSSLGTKADQATKVTVEKLLNEAISQMISIRNRKMSSSQQTEVTYERIPSRHKDKEHTETHRPEPSVEHTQDTEPSVEALNDDLYDFESDDPWNDDDFYDISTKPLNAIEKTDSLKRPEVRLDLQKLTEETFYFIPNKTEEVKGFVNQTIDFFWERRRYGESWEGVTMPSQLMTPDEKGPDVESRSRRVYKKLLFDLTAQVLCDMYREEEEDLEHPPWSKQRLPRPRYHREKSPPTTVDVLRPIVMNHVTQVMGLRQKDAAGDRTKGRKWATRKKKDRVDQVLAQDLAEEEPQWVNYDDDELAVKNRLVDSLFMMLLMDTGHAVTKAMERSKQMKIL